jgi:hypothetical protein
MAVSRICRMAEQARLIHGDADLERTLWVLCRPPNKPITAAIFRRDAALELRVRYGDDPTLLDSLISDEADAEALEWRAEMFRGVLEANGWAVAADF